MQYYTFELSKQAKELCVTISSFSKYAYQRIPTGFKQSPDFAQEVMEDIFHDMANIEVYIDDIDIFANSKQHSLELQDKVFKCLKANGFTVNPFKCKWMVPWTLAKTRRTQTLEKEG
jgi:hypothetical protein